MGNKYPSWERGNARPAPMRSKENVRNKKPEANQTRTNPSQSPASEASIFFLSLQEGATPSHFLFQQEYDSYFHNGRLAIDCKGDSIIIWKDACPEPFYSYAKNLTGASESVSVGLGIHLKLKRKKLNHG